MPVKYRITILFTLLVLLILAFVCGSVYYFSYVNRIQEIKTRLTNRAITTGRLLSQTGVFDLNLIHRIDASTTVSMKSKVVEAYDYLNNKIYWYSDNPGDTISVPGDIINDARTNGERYFTFKEKDAVAYHYAGHQTNLIIIAAAFDEEGNNKLWQLRVILWLSFAAGILISMIGGYLFSTSLLNPLRKITDEVNEISAGSLTRRISTPGAGNTDEWFYLSETLNKLLNRLQDSFETQGRFIANASHELTTPLTSISSQLEVTLQRPRDSDYYQQTIRSVYEDVQLLNKLTLSLLEFAKAAGTASGLEIDLLRIDEIILRLPSEIAKINAQYSMSIDFNSMPEQEEKLFVFGNPELLFSALKNIVLNACKYSSNHKARVSLVVQTKEIQVIVEDNGMGIPEKDLENIFQPFYRIEEVRATEGFGLGLPLSNRIIKLHRGFIHVQSKLNEGTIISITLPVASNFTTS
jgi:two-component system, OmpR family, sensor histidine kinase ArlS